MRYFILLLILLLLFSFCFAGLKPLVRYSDDSVISHACNPSSPLCLYTNEISIDEQYLGTESSGVRVIGLSSETNAHAEISPSSLYPSNIYLRSDAFSSGLCHFVSGASCSTGENCILGLSDGKNAHLSKCGVFPAETKLCCTFSSTITVVPFPNPVLSSCEGIGLNVVSSKVNEKTVVGVSCPAGESLKMIFFNSKGDVLFGPMDIACSGGLVNYDGVIPAQKGVYGVKVFFGDCFVERYFSPTSEGSMQIPDNNFSALLVILLVVVLTIFNSKVEKKS